MYEIHSPLVYLIFMQTSTLLEKLVIHFNRRKYAEYDQIKLNDNNKIRHVNHYNHSS